MYAALIEQILEKCREESLVFEERGEEVSLSFVCPKRAHVGRFFYDMTSRWLIPGRHLPVHLHFSTEYEGFCVCHTVLHVGKFLELAKKNFVFLKQEILMGASSFYQATKILEMKGLNLDDKTALVQDKIGALVRRFPERFDYDLFSDMQQFLVRMKENFKADRGPNEISRIIFTLYRFRKILEEKRGEKRYLCLKLKKTRLQTPFGQKEVLSVFLALNFLKKHEIFEKRHLFAALSHLCPSVVAIKGSYFSQNQTFYLEVEKEGFTSEEIQVLREKLRKEILGRIEQLVAPIFMPRNEEEVMRGILALSQQLKMTRDLPQVTISFDEQTSSDFCFTVIIMRVLLPESQPIEELLKKSELDVTFDRTKKVGMLRRKYVKEATVLRVRMENSDFIREDFSVDLLNARAHLVQEIQMALGEIRDYNGGMISKQSESFLQLKKILGPLAKKHPLVLQNFFHCIVPAHMSTTLDPNILSILFTMLVGAMEKKGAHLQLRQANDSLFALAKIKDFSLKGEILEKIPKKDLVKVEMQIFDSLYLGFISLNPESRAFDFFQEAGHTYIHG